MYNATQPNVQDIIADDKRTQSPRYRYVQWRIVAACRWYNVKKVLGWPAVILGDSMPARWFNRDKTANPEWNEILAELARRSEKITRLMIDKLVEALGERIVPGILPEAGDEDFSLWFKRLGTSAEDRHNGALQAVLLIAARITDYSLSYPSNLDQGYLFTELKLYLSSTRAWPIVGNVLTRFMREFVPRTPGSPVVYPLVSASLES
jgi:hypothetical protein